MGKQLIIKGADFSLNGINKVTLAEYEYGKKEYTGKIISINGYRFFAQPLKNEAGRLRELSVYRRQATADDVVKIAICTIGDGNTINKGDELNILWQDTYNTGTSYNDTHATFNPNIELPDNVYVVLKASGTKNNVPFVATETNEALDGYWEINDSAKYTNAIEDYNPIPTAGYVTVSQMTGNLLIYAKVEVVELDT